MREQLQRIFVDVTRVWLQRGGNLTETGRSNFKNLATFIKKVEKTSFSKHIDILDGFELSVEGLSCLEEIKDKHALFLSNHTNNGPLKGYWKLFVLNHLVQERTHKEIKWTYGKDKSTLQEFARKMIGESLETIAVREGNGAEGIRSILNAFNQQESVGLFPEGDGNKTLLKGDPKAGGIILLAARRSIPIIVISGWVQENICHVNFLPLDQITVLELGSNKDKPAGKQNIVDYAMTQIAQRLPLHLRGYYRSS